MAPPSKVSSIRRSGAGNFYDLTVPIAHHYYAAGVIHHNTGKTWAACAKGIEMCVNVPGAQGALVRKTAASVPGTVLRTFKAIAGSGVTYYGGESPSRIIFPNGSQIWIGGMDNSDRVLGAERDFIQVSQAEELTLDDWEKLATRCSGRGAKVQHPQLFADCNPGGSRHWIRERAKAGKLRLITSRHQDNPTIYDAAGNLTEEGARRLAVLDNLTGVRRKRLKEGVWATAEGAVYDMFDPAVHVKVRSREEMRRFYLAVDIGYTNPAAVLDVGEDGDGRWHCFREFYRTQVVPEDLAATVAAWWSERRYELCVVDAAAAGFIASLVSAGVRAVGGKGTVLGKAGSGGIQAVQNRLKVQGDGLPRYTLDPSCVNHQNEFESYSWKPGQDVPEKEHDHCFVGDTLILTKAGWKRIDSIQVGEYVLSPFGWNRVWKAGFSGYREVRDYGLFQATPDHKILTDRGLVPIDALRYLDYVWTWQQSKKWSLTEFLTGAILSPARAMSRFISGALLTKSLEAARDTFTGTCGNSITARFRLARKCITRTAILRTIAWTIWSSSLAKSTLASIAGAASRLWTMLGSLPASGTAQKPESSGIGNTGSELGSKGSCRQSSAKLAAKSIKHPFLVEAGSVGLTARCEPCASGGSQTSRNTSPTGTAILAPTFNLSTEWGCYFANGVLVSNSLDALRYLQDQVCEPTGAFDPAALPPPKPARDPDGDVDVFEPVEVRFED